MIGISAQVGLYGLRHEQLGPAVDAAVALRMRSRRPAASDVDRRLKRWRIVLRVAAS
jgi:hypothetical protein